MVSFNLKLLKSDANISLQISFIHNHCHNHLKSAKDDGPKRASRKDEHEEGKLRVLSYVPIKI